MTNITDKVAEAAPKERKQTGGEIVVERGIFTGVGFGVNELSSLWFTKQFIYGKNLLGKAPGFLKSAGSWFSKEGYEKLSKKLAPVFKNDSAKAGNMLLMVMLLSGGTLLVWPMKKMKDNEEYLVRKTNHLLDRIRGRKMTPEEVAARDDEVDKALACKPKQSWGTLLTGRAIAMLSSVGTGTFLVGKKNNDALMDWSEKTFAGSIQPEGKKKALNIYARLASVETYSCILSSVVLELASKFFARRGTVKHNPELCEEGKAAPASAPASGGSTDDEKTQTPDIPASLAALETRKRSHAAAITPASRDVLSPSSSHGEKIRQGETYYPTHS